MYCSRMKLDFDKKSMKTCSIYIGRIHAACTRLSHSHSQFAIDLQSARLSHNFGEIIFHYCDTISASARKTQSNKYNQDWDGNGEKKRGDLMMGEKVKQEIEKVSLFGKQRGTGPIVSRLRVAIPAVRQVETLWWGSSFKPLFSRRFHFVILLGLPLNKITFAAHPRQDRQQNRRLRRCRGRSHRCRQRSRTHARSAYSGK